ncbi:hypothetical protein BDM02DRAFT_3119890 [Thelephora ganbajun]|uniref:Uncharacterized protein n=1 Tax=Thelephora ganbajun TaxID=370292 RepID=A0ACB6Z7W9_THEGA|nr:hypothetical protein BDM02DRAFT_3119890 [Thelephora ganbajun]
MSDLSWFKARGNQPGCSHTGYHLLHHRVVMVLVIALPNAIYAIYAPRININQLRY